MVDNCYGEFVKKEGPSDVGADMVVGSSSRIQAAVSPPSAAISAAPKPVSPDAPTGSPPRDWGRRSAPIWDSCPSCIRAFPASHRRGRRRKGPFLPPACMSRWASAASPAQQKAGTTSSKLWSWAVRRPWSPLPGNSGCRPGGQLRYSHALGHARLREQGHHGGRCFRTRFFHRAFCRRPNPPALRRLFPRRPHLVSCQAGHSHEVCKAL